jgi:adenylate cyclase
VTGTGEPLPAHTKQALAREHERITLTERQIKDNLTAIGVAHFFSRRFGNAAASLVVSVEAIPGWVVTYRFLAACYAHMGRLEEARETVKRLREITPVVIPGVIPYRNPEHRELFLSGLRLAAGEAT